MQERGTGPALTEARARTRHYRLLAAVAAAVVAVDQLTKWWAVEALSDGHVELVWTLRLRLVRNTGAAFSLGAGRGLLVVLIVVVVIGVMVWLGRGITTGRGAAALGLVLGGAFGNLADRAFRSGDGFLGGGVVDFIDFQWWPVFNMADIAVTSGVIALVLFGSLTDDG